ncbi:MAG: hypothetical protein QW524_00690 [Candidatus Woesearchaeota archaeon]
MRKKLNIFLGQYVILGFIFGLFFSLFFQSSTVILGTSLHLLTGNIVKQRAIYTINYKCYPFYDEEEFRYYLCKNLSEFEFKFLESRGVQIKKENDFYLISFKEIPEYWR